MNEYLSLSIRENNLKKRKFYVFQGAFERRVAIPQNPVIPAKLRPAPTNTAIHIIHDATKRLPSVQRRIKIPAVSWTWRIIGSLFFVFSPEIISLGNCFLYSRIPPGKMLRESISVCGSRIFFASSARRPERHIRSTLLPLRSFATRASRDSIKSRGKSTESCICSTVNSSFPRTSTMIS